MKKIAVLLSLIVGSSCLFAQTGHSIKQVKQPFGSLGELETYELMIQQAVKEDVAKGLVKQLEKKTRTKAVESTEMISIDKVFYEGYWLDSLSIKAIPMRKENGTLVTFTFDKDGQSVGEKNQPDLHVSIKKYLKNFALDMYEDAVEDELKTEEKRLKAIEKELKSELHNEDKIRKKIEGIKIDKTDKQEEIAQNQAARESKIDEIQAQKDKMTNMAGSKEAKKEEKAKLKTMNSELKGMKKANKKMNKAVFKMDNRIRDLELERVSSVSQQKAIQTRIDAKNQDIAAVKKKLYAVEEERN